MMRVAVIAATVAVLFCISATAIAVIITAQHKALVNLGMNEDGTVKPSFSDVPIYGGDVDAYINSTGIIQFSAKRLLEVTSQETAKPLQSGEVNVSSLDRITEAMYSEDTIVVSDAQLYYYPSDADTYTPLWMFSLQYAFTNPDQVKENRTALVWIDAFTAEEVIFRAEA